MRKTAAHLSCAFQIDPTAAWVRRHNAEAAAVMEAWQRNRPIRVPVCCGEWLGQHGFYAEETGLDYRQYYSDPDEMVRVQLETARRRRELPIHDDLPLGQAPDRWSIGVDLWPVVSPAWIGCQLLYRKDEVIAHLPLNRSKTECARMKMPDPVHGGILKQCHAFHQHIQSRCGRQMTFLGRPVGPAGHGIGTNGFFSLALDIRGADLMADMCEDPVFAHRFLQKIADWCETLERVWCNRTGRPVPPFALTDHGIDMLSPATYERFIVPVIVAMNRRRGTTPPTELHHCGRGAHLFPVIKKHFGLTRIHALTWPLVDIARVRAELGEEVKIAALLEDSIVQRGPAERIRETVRDLLTHAKGQGGLSLVTGDMLKGTPMEHRVICYEAVREWGRYCTNLGASHHPSWPRCTPTTMPDRR